MSYTVFARKYRPQTFDEVVGQQHIVQTLKNAITSNRLAQAYLFVGPRGTGKTTTARILAKALNCTGGPKADFDPADPVCVEIAEGRSMDVLEFDAASNTQVDKIREIIVDNVKFAATRGKYKVYIVDEVHMLSTSSFNALLKTLEEPPPHVKFVFATTDVQKVPTTIISRCQRFDLRRISTPEIAEHLLFIAGREKITLSSAAAEAVARGAEGGMRDAESMLDQLVAFCGEKIAEEDVLNVFGFTSAQTVAALCDHLIGGDAAAALRLIHEQSDAGKDLSRLMADLIAHLRNLLVIQCDPTGVKDELSAEAIAALGEQSQRIAREKLLDLIEQFAGAEARMKWAPNKKMHFEVSAIRAIQTLNQATLTEVLDTLTAMRGGAPAPAAARPATASKPLEIRVPKVASPSPPPTPAANPAAGPVTPPAPEVPPPAFARPPSLMAAVAAELGITRPPVEPPAVPEPASSVHEEPPAPVKVPPAPGVLAATLWPKLVAQVRQERPLIQGWVEAGQLQEVASDTAVLAFPPESGLARESCERANNRGYLEGVLSEIAGRAITLRCVTREGLVVGKVPSTQTKAAPPADPQAAFRDDPLIKKALAEFNAEIISG